MSKKKKAVERKTTARERCFNSVLGKALATPVRNSSRSFNNCWLQSQFRHLLSLNTLLVTHLEVAKLEGKESFVLLQN